MSLCNWLIKTITGYDYVGLQGDSHMQQYIQFDTVLGLENSTAYNISEF